MKANISETWVIAHIDLDYFFAQCEEREEPKYKDKPVVICVFSGRGSDSGAVSTANYIARNFGVKSGMPIIFAKRLLKNEEAIFLPVNHELYKRISKEVMNLLRNHADKFEQESIDEASIDITSTVNHDFIRAKALAQEIKNEILEKERLTCSIGVASNKLVAKMASSYQKPNGLTVIKPENVKNFLSPLPIGKLYGVGRKTEKTMQGLGIKSIGDLAQYRVEDLTKVFGLKLGTYFHEAANGINESPVQDRGIMQISRIVTLKEDTRDILVIAEELNQLCVAIQRRIIDENFSFHSVGIMIVAENMSIHSKNKKLSSDISDLGTLKEVSYKLLERFLLESPFKIRRIGVKVTDLTSTSTQKFLSDFK